MSAPVLDKTGKAPPTLAGVSDRWYVLPCNQFPACDSLIGAGQVHGTRAQGGVAHAQVLWLQLQLQRKPEHLPAGHSQPMPSLSRSR